jgi:DNA-binding transcriptional ArsR family regulator
MTNVKRPLLERRLKTSQITLQKLEVFHLVVRLGSVTRAAERLGIAQPAVTSHLRSLEDKVGATLLRRDGRNLVLTASAFIPGRTKSLPAAMRWSGTSVACATAPAVTS